MSESKLTVLCPKCGATCMRCNSDPDGQVTTRSWSCDSYEALGQFFQSHICHKNEEAAATVTLTKRIASLEAQLAEARRESKTHPKCGRCLDLEGEIAMAADHMNTQAREWGVLECHEPYEAANLRALAERLWLRAMEREQKKSAAIEAQLAQREQEVERLREVASWAQATLTALNIGDVKSGSPLHLKLREVMIASRVNGDRT